jgi:hypothetical protein
MQQYTRWSCQGLEEVNSFGALILFLVRLHSTLQDIMYDHVYVLKVRHLL